MAEILREVIISDDIVLLKSFAQQPDPQPAPTISDHATATVSVINHDDLENARQAGYLQGLSEGIAKTEAKMTDELSVLATLLQSIPAAINDRRMQLSDEIADIVLLITRQFFINQQLNKDGIALQINQTINQLNDKQNIELALHPEDLALLQQGLLKIDLKSCKNLRVIPDESLRLGGCIVKSEHGVFDASIERQIDNLKQVLLQMKQGMA